MPSLKSTAPTDDAGPPMLTDQLPQPLRFRLVQTATAPPVIRESQVRRPIFRTSRIAPTSRVAHGVLPPSTILGAGLREGDDAGPAGRDDAGDRHATRTDAISAARPLRRRARRPRLRRPDAPAGRLPAPRAPERLARHLRPVRRRPHHLRRHVPPPLAPRRGGARGEAPRSRPSAPSPSATSTASSPPSTSCRSSRTPRTTASRSSTTSRSTPSLAPGTTSRRSAGAST